MSLKTNLVISVVFAALLAFVYFHEIKGNEERELDAERARQLIDFSDHEAQRLTIIQPESTIVVSREDGDWVITEPLRTGADTEAIERYLRSLKETEVEGEPVQDSARVAGGKTSLAPYGLDMPRLSVHMGLAASAAHVLDTLHFGIDTPTQRFTYIQRSGENPEVRTIRAWRYDNLDKGLFDLRDRRVLHFDRDEVVELRVRTGSYAGQDWVARRQDGVWRLTSPFETRADDKTFTQILTRLQNARIESFEVERPTAEDLDRTGLAAGDESLRFTLTTQDAEQNRVERNLRLGRRQARDDHYAIDDQREPVYILDSAIVSQLTRPLDDLRDRQPFRLSPAEVVAIDMTISGATIYRATRDSSGGWQLISHPERQAKAWRLNDLLTAVDGLRVEQFVADAEDVLDLELLKFGLDQSQVRLALHRQGGDVLFIEVARKDDRLYARRVDVPSIYEIAVNALADLAPNLDDVAGSSAESAAGAASTEAMSGSGGQ